MRLHVFISAKIHLATFEIFVFVRLQFSFWFLLKQPFKVSQENQKLTPRHEYAINRELRVPPLFVALRLFILHWIVLRRDKNIHLSRGFPRFPRGTRGDQLSPTGYKDGDYNWLPINCQWGGDQKDITEPYGRIKGEGSFYQAYVGRTFSKFLFLSNSIELLKRSWWNDFFHRIS